MATHGRRARRARRPAPADGRICQPPRSSSTGTNTSTTIVSRRRSRRALSDARAPPEGARSRGQRPRPCAVCGMFSTSMIASSTTRPARSPGRRSHGVDGLTERVQYEGGCEQVRDGGDADDRGAQVHRKRNRTSTSAHPRPWHAPRLSSARSMKPAAGRWWRRADSGQVRTRPARRRYAARLERVARLLLDDQQETCALGDQAVADRRDGPRPR